MKRELMLISNVATAQLGQVWVAFTRRGLAAVEFGVCRSEFEASIRKQARRSDVDVRAGESGEPGVHQAAQQILEYLQGRRRRFDLPIDWLVLGSDFQRAALQAVMAIPFGQTRTYGQIAAVIGHPDAPRAVGRANATNPMPLVIPCHRVLGTDGKLHGYGGVSGLETKQWLLDLERCVVAQRPIPARPSTGRVE